MGGFVPWTIIPIHLSLGQAHSRLRKGLAQEIGKGFRVRSRLRPVPNMCLVPPRVCSGFSPVKVRRTMESKHFTLRLALLSYGPIFKDATY